MLIIEVAIVLMVLSNIFMICTNLLHKYPDASDQFLHCL
jgi:hypothetical protein